MSTSEETYHFNNSPAGQDYELQHHLSSDHTSYAEKIILIPVLFFL